MNDIEERVRSGLHGVRTGQLDLGVDADDVLEIAKGVRTQRRVLWTIGTVAAALVVGMASYSLVLGRTIEGPAVPAAPASTPVVVDGRARVSFDLTDNEVPERYASLVAEVSRSGAEVDAALTVFDASGLPQFSTSTGAGDDAISQVSMGLDDGTSIEVGLIDEVARWVVPIGGAAGAQVAQRELPALDVTVYLLVFPPSQGEPITLPNVVWQGLDGAVRVGVGREITSATVSVAGRSGTAYLDEGLDTFGYADSDGFGFRFAASEASKRTRCYFSGQELKGSWESTVFCLLPPGAQNPEAQLAESTKVALVDLADRLLVVMPGSADSINGIVKSVTYTTADGREVTDPA